MKNSRLYSLIFILVLTLLLCASCAGRTDQTTSAAPDPATSAPSSTASTSTSETTADTAADTTEAPATEPAAVSLPVNPLIPDQRISVCRAGINSNFNLSETGIYCLVQEKKGTFILYCDKDSDEFIKLCGRPDCLHDDETCDACLYDNMIPSMGYYNGKIYYIKNSEENISSGAGEQSKQTPHTLMRMDADGRNKEELTYCYEEGMNYTGYGNVSYSNGIVEGYFSSVGTDGTVECVRMYTPLDDPGYFIPTVVNPEILTELREAYGSIYAGSSDRILLTGFPDEKGDKLYIWDYKENSIAGTLKKPNASGTFTAETGYYMEDSTVMQWDYEKQEGHPLFDTGLSAPLALVAFPDCFAVYENYGFVMAGEADVSSASINFYNWDFEHLGECVLQLGERSGSFKLYGNYIFGETEDRILLVKDALNSMLPDYYIEKSDFGRGEITLHEYHYPEMDLLD